MYKKSTQTKQCDPFIAGRISVRRKLKRKANYRLRVEARINDDISASVTVLIRVTDPKKKFQPNRDQGLKFPSPIYSVIIPYNMLVGQTILHLRVEKTRNFTNAVVSYGVQSVYPYHKKPFFILNPVKGSLKINRELSELSADERPTSFVLQVAARTQGKPGVFATTQVSIVVVPEYAGNDYVKSSLVAVKNRSIATDSSERLRSQNNRTSSGKLKSPPGRTEFSLHRIFRQPSPEAQRISKADLQFNKIIREIKREVAKQLIGKLLLQFYFRQLL